jgi:hypothetical protein
VTLTIGHDDDAAARAVWDMLHEDIGTQLAERNRGFADLGPGPLEKLATVARGIDWLAEAIGYAVWTILESKSARAIKLRAALRQALALIEPYDQVAPEIHELGVALRRRQIYFIVRRSAAVLEAEGAGDVAAQLLDAAAQYEPDPDIDHLAFSPRRRLKSEHR